MTKKTPQQDNNEPVLLEESYIKEQKNPPWILIGFLLFAIISAFWKKFISPTFAPDPPAQVEQQNTPPQESRAQRPTR